MSRISYVNGRYVRHAGASVHVEDRGFQFADGVYEVCAVRDGDLVDEAPHLARLERSLRELRMNAPVGGRALALIMRETVRLNGVRTGLVYIQVSRGRARRDHGFPAPGTPPTLVVSARSLDLGNYDRLAATGVGIVLVPETRWARCDIKSTALLANVLAKQQARDQGAFEAWFVGSDGFITEGSSTNAWIVDRAGTLRTRGLSHAILPGVTRGEVLALCRQHGIGFAETPFTEEELRSAREAFITAATIGVLPVTRLDGASIGDGKPGPVSTRLRSVYAATRAG